MSTSERSSTQPAKPRRVLSPRQRMAARVALGLWWVFVAAPVGLAVWTYRPYWFDLASHFLPLVAAAWVLLALVLAALRRWGFALVTLASASAIMVICRSDARAPVGMNAGKPPEGYARVRVVHYNAYGEHSRNDNEFIAWLRDQNADLISLVDPPWGWRRDYPFLLREFPYVVEPEAGLEWPNVLLSRWPAEVTPLVEFSEAVVFSFVARRSLLVQLADDEHAGTLLFTAMHPPSPRSPKTWATSLMVVERDGPILRDWGARSGVPMVIAGDFNSTVQGRVHRTFARTSGLTGWSPVWSAGTWPASQPRWFSLPIDRVFTGGGVVVRSMTVGPRFRSDHRPVVVVLDVPVGASERSAP